MTRFAGASKVLGEVLKYIQPSSKTDALMRFGPDLFFAGMAAMNAPEGTDPFKRALIGLEDAAIGLGGSVLLGGAARAGAAKLHAQLPEEQLSKRIEQWGMAGDMAAMPLNFMAPRPMLESAINDAIANQKKQEELAQQYQEQDVQQRLLAAALQSPGLFV